MRALRGAALTVRAGEVHGVLGENGAGKTTLLGVLAGMVRPDAGDVTVGGSRVRLATPRDAWRVGVGMVHQHFTLVPTLTVLENLALGRRSAGGFSLALDALWHEARALQDRTGLRVDLSARVETLGVGSRQRVEILRTLLRDPKVLVLDEPTAVLTPGEVDTLFALLRDLAAAGRAVVLVAHKLDEVLAVAHRLTVLRAGVTVFQGPGQGVSAGMLARAMVGEVEDADVEAEVGVGRDGAPADPARRAARLRTPGRAVAFEADAGPPVARLVDVRVRGARSEWALDGVSLTVRRGEVVGVAGVEGNGQHELALVLAGRVRPDSGGAEIPGGVGFIPQDRTREGLAADFDITENVALAAHREPESRWGPFLRWSRLRREAETLIARYGVRAPGPGTRAGALSGGNQQRVLVGRELGRARDLLVAENPTRGLDVRAAAFVHERLRRLCLGESGGGDRAGAASDPSACPGVVLISTDLDEVLALSDRVLVMVRGTLREAPAGMRTRRAVGEMMLSAGGPGGA